MTTTSSSTDTGDSVPNTCANCFAEFEWTPFVQDGEDYCCSGCADGGPCICTYTGAPHVTAVGIDTGDVSFTQPGGEEPDSEGPESSGPVAESGSGGDEPPQEPPVAGEPSPEDQPPPGDRLNVILAAISEMPLPVQEVVRARLTTQGSEEEIGEPLGLDAAEVAHLLAQGQAMLDRVLGPGYAIRYMPGARPEEGRVPEQQFPAFPSFDDVDETDETDQPQAAEPQAEEQPSDLGQLIARSVDNLSRASTGDSPEERAARDALAEALREAGNLFRLASERVTSPTPPAESLRSELADTRDDEETVTLIVRNPGDISPLFMALQDAGSVQLTRLDSLTTEQATFRLSVASMMGLVRDLMVLGGRLRPSRLQMSGNEITIELPPDTSSAAAQGGLAPRQRFELTIDSFFGARHFVMAGSNQGPPHHHSYRVEAAFVSFEPDRHGFVMGFASVRELVESTVMNYSETLLNTEDPFREIPPTTENLARVFHEHIGAKLRDLNQPGVRLKHVRVWESPTNSASYSETGPDAAITA